MNTADRINGHKSTHNLDISFYFHGWGKCFLFSCTCVVGLRFTFCASCWPFPILFSSSFTHFTSFAHTRVKHHFLIVFEQRVNGAYVVLHLSGSLKCHNWVSRRSNRKLIHQHYSFDRSMYIIRHRSVLASCVQVQRAKNSEWNSVLLLICPTEFRIQLKLPIFDVVSFSRVIALQFIDWIHFAWLVCNVIPNGSVTVLCSKISGSFVSVIHWPYAIKMELLKWRSLASHVYFCWSLFF